MRLTVVFVVLVVAAVLAGCWLIRLGLDGPQVPPVLVPTP